MTKYKAGCIVRSIAPMLVAFGLSGSVAAEPAASALDRPSVMSPHAAQSVLLAAARTDGNVVAVGERGIVLVSEDGGHSWAQVATPVSVTLTGVRFADAKHGYIVGHGGTVLTTADGGRTWTRRLDGRRAAQLALEAAKASGDERAVRDAERLVSDGPDKPFLDILIEDAQHAVVVGAYGLAFATADGGQSWTSWMARLDNPDGLHLYAIRRRGEHILVAGEQGLVRLSADGGQHFEVIDTPYEGSFFTAELPSSGSIVLAGLRGNIWRSDDDGANWAQMAVPMPVSITASAVLADGSLIFANQAGFVLGERNGTLQPLNQMPLPALNGLLPLPGGALLALDIRGTAFVNPGDPQ